jgi:hypothetical protein
MEEKLEYIMASDVLWKCALHTPHQNELLQSAFKSWALLK